MYNKNEREQDEIHSKVLRAGRRTYFFDVCETKANDYYLTITESKKFTNDDGTFSFKKHKIYLYKEDFREFKSILNEILDYIIKQIGEEVISDRYQKSFERTKSLDSRKEKGKNFTDFNFEDV